MSKPKLLWCGDAVVPSGFSRCTHAALPHVAQEWDVIVIGINYDGSPHDYPYKIYPAARAFTGEDAFGVTRFESFIREWRPDAAVLLNDPWNVPAYLSRAADVPTVAWLAVDGKNCRGEGLNGLAGAVFWTQFAATEATLGGYVGPSAVVPLGVDADLFVPLDRDEARGPTKIGLPERCRSHFIVGAVGRNQERKRLDLTLMYFADWIKSGIDDASLLLHVAPTNDDAYDIDQLTKYLGLAGRVIKITPRGQGLQNDAMPWIYACMDVQLSTTQGEGFGLCHLEGMACGIPQIVPDWSGLGEWARPAAALVPCTTLACTPSRINAIGGIPDRGCTIDLLDRLYRDVAERHRLATAGRALAERAEYQWSHVGRAFADALRGWAWPAAHEVYDETTIGSSR